jgi:hypothetical protein
MGGQCKSEPVARFRWQVALSQQCFRQEIVAPCWMGTDAGALMESSRDGFSIFVSIALGHARPQGSRRG